MRSLSYPLYFNHVPKCGGTSLNELLARSLHRNALGLEPFVSTLHLYNLPAARLDQLSLVGSHFPHWAAARRLAGWSRLAVVRQPWPRFQSLTRHLVRIQSSEPQALLPAQVRYLSLVRAGRFADALRQAVDWYPFHASMAQCFLPVPPQSGIDFGAHAVEGLSGYDAVLLAERLSDDWDALERIFNGPSLGQASRLNTSAEYGDRSEGPFPKEMERLFHDLFPFETRVYDAAQEAYSETRRLLAEQARSVAGTKRQSAAALAAVDWDAPTRCAGFSDRSVAASFGYQGRYARRVESPVSVLEIDLPPPVSMEARLEGVFWISPVTSRFKCGVAINGIPVRMFDEANEVPCPSDAGQLWTSAPIAGEALRSGRLRIEFDRRRAVSLTEFWVLDLAVRCVGRDR